MLGSDKLVNEQEFFYFSYKYFLTNRKIISSNFNPS